MAGMEIFWPVAFQLVWGSQGSRAKEGKRLSLECPKGPGQASQSTVISCKQSEFCHKVWTQAENKGSNNTLNNGVFYETFSAINVADAGGSFDGDSTTESAVRCARLSAGRNPGRRLPWREARRGREKRYDSVARFGSFWRGCGRRQHFADEPKCNAGRRGAKRQRRRAIVSVERLGRIVDASSEHRQFERIRRRIHYQRHSVGGKRGCGLGFHGQRPDIRSTG